MKTLLVAPLAFLLLLAAALAQAPALPADSASATPVAQPAAATATATGRGARGAGARGTGARGNRGAAPANNNDAFYKIGPDSQPMNGVPKGHWVGPTTIPTAAFPGNFHTYWVYVPAQYDPSIPTALTIFNDGQAFKKEPGDIQAQNVLDNLIYRHEIPVMLGVFIDPAHLPSEPEPPDPVTGDWGDRGTRRPVEYNPPTDIYAKVVCDELMPALQKDYNISPDPDLHAIVGASSGGCAAFAVAWFRPDQFHKVITIVGSFTDLKGEYIYPDLVAASDKKPIRIFMQDGRNDNRALTGNNYNPKMDWFLQNNLLMQALTKKGYDVNYAWGMNNHGQKMGGAILPDMMRWLWRDQPVDTDPHDTAERAFRPAVTPPASAAAAASDTTAK
jgi:enterochelin esterase family protein